MLKKDRGISDKVWDMVKREDERQVAKWGIQNCTPFEWLTYTTEELGELAEAISDHAYERDGADNVVKEAIQVATLALKIATMYHEEK